MSKLIKDWSELIGLESDNYIIVSDTDYSAWIEPKTETEETESDYYKHHVYLSTHTFYESQYKASTQLLQSYGFDVELESWD